MDIRTNYHRRPILDACELTLSEQSQFDYLDWTALQEGNDSRSFVRYQGRLYDLGDLRETVPAELRKAGWQNWQSDSFYSGIAFRWLADDDESIIVATVIF